MEITMLYLLTGLIIGIVIGGITGFLVGCAQERFEAYERQLKKAIDDSKQDLLKAQIKQEILEELKSEKP
jgi:uncharacterized membrane protein YraQ (UPF0718 family)